MEQFDRVMTIIAVAFLLVVIFRRIDIVTKRRK